MISLLLDLLPKTIEAESITGRSSCILSFLWVSNSKSRIFFQYFHLSKSYDNECDKILEVTYETYYATL